MTRHAVLSAVWLAAAGLAGAQGTPTNEPQAMLVTASGRGVFLRGEVVKLHAELPLAAPGPALVTLRAAGHAAPVPLLKATLTPAAGKASLNVLVPTDALGSGDYTAALSVGAVQAEASFAVRETAVRSPGMVGDDMCGWSPLAPNARLARQTAHTAFMNGPLFDLTGTAVSGKRADLNRAFDAYTDQQILCWYQDATRPMSFCPPHSSPTTDGEYRRRLVLGELAFMQYPAFAGQIMDYDPTGFLDKHVQLVTYWGWGNLRDDLAAYMQGQEDALRRDFKQATGYDAPTPAELLGLAAAVGSPEAMGYIDLPTRRWAFQVAARSPKMEPAKLEALKQKAFAWYGYLMGLNERRYAAYLQPLKALDPTVAISTANTINHCTPRDGGYHPSSYRPLDFRFASVWDDQGGAPEHIYETALAATLLNGDRRADQPLWIDTVFGWLNGHHFRNTLLLVGRGAQGTGYSSEMGCNLAANARAMLQGNTDRNQEVDLTGRFMERLGGLFARVQPRPRVGLLYSARQIAMTPYAQSFVDGSFKVMYLLAHCGLTPCLVTEEMLADGQVPASVNAIVVLGQSESLPAPAEQALRRFADAGGWVVADTRTSVPWDFLRRCPALDLPHWDLGHPYNMLTAYNRQDASIIELRALAAERCPQLRVLFQGVLRGLPLDCTNPDVGLAELQGGQARFVVVCNDAQVDLAQLFTPAQRRTTAYQSLLVGHGTGVLGSWMPLTAELLLAPELAASGPPPAARGGYVYDLLRGRLETGIARSGGAEYVACDMSAVPGGLYAVYPCQVGGGRAAAAQSVAAGAPIALSYQATAQAGTDLAAVVPVEITLRGPGDAPRAVYYRATDAAGRLAEEIPTGSFDPPGACALEVRQLLDGAGVRLPVTLMAAKLPAASEAPAVAVRDPQALRQYLAGKPELVIPVFDAVLKPFAEKAAAALNRQGAKARVWENPPITNYALAYVVKPEQQPDNERVERGEAIGRVQFQNMVHHVNGNFYGSALTGFRFGKSVVLLGTPGQNAVLDGVRASGLLWTDAATEAAGGGLVQRLPYALGREADTLVIEGADLAGLAAAVDALALLPESDPVGEGVKRARTQLLAGRAVPRRLESAPPARGLTAKGAAVLKPDGASAPDCALVPVRQVLEWGETLAVSLGRYGENVVLIQPDGKVTVLPAISTTCEVRPGRNILVTSLPGLACAWNRAGQLLWRARGDVRAVQLGSDVVILEQDKQFFQVGPNGQADASDWKASEAAPAPAPFKTEVVTEKRGQDDVVQEIKVTHAASGQTVKGLWLTADKLSWNVPFVVNQSQVAGKSGNVVVVFRRWVGEPGAQVYDRSVDKVVELPVDTAYLTDAALATDEKHVAVAGMEGEVRVFDLAGKRLNAARIGAYPRLFPLADGGFAVGCADGKLARLDAEGRVLWTRNLLQSAGAAAPEKAYAVYRAAPLVTPPTVAPADAAGVRFEAFYGYLRDDGGEFKMINFPPTSAPQGAELAFDFRWMDVAQGEVVLPAARTYALTLKAAAKYFDDEPLAQPSWKAILALRRTVVQHERPAPCFAIYLDGKRVGTLTPEGGTLKPFVTPPINEGWALLKPKDEELTVFRGDLELAAGSHLLGIEAVNMEDCYVKGVEVK